MDIKEIAEKNSKALGLFLAGIFLIGAGFLFFKVSTLSEGTQVELLEETGQPAEEKREKILVEIAGEVINPGVYELESGSRVNDLLIKGGGFSVEADRKWVSKNINLAQELVDGAKFYIPPKEENPNSNNQIPNNISNSNYQTLKININTASGAELDTLWGVGEVTAKKIIEGRPYQRTEELLEKKIVKSNVWESIKDEIKVY
ncbi:helix-hairpin-helix domain-containing protein [Patescibacteria group bacterium]|nr:helix-hairpin-helix domain-containing protein [Patescibacteria group bacterium]